MALPGGVSKASGARRVIVTRPAEDAQAWVSKLHHAGIHAQALPLIEIVAVSDCADVLAVRQAIRHSGSYCAVMFVSANAVRHFLGLLSASNMPVAQVKLALAAPENIANQWPHRLRFLAPGPGTVAALLAAGVPAGQIDAPLPEAAQFDSEALWQVIGQRDWQAGRVLVVRGKGDAADTSAGSGRDWLAQQWQASGAAVDVVSSYQRRAPDLTAHHIELAKAAGGDGSVWLFSSSAAVANLLGQPGLQGFSWQRAVAIATHPRIEACMRAAGWGVVRVSRPALADIVKAVASIESQGHE